MGLRARQGQKLAVISGQDAVSHCSGAARFHAAERDETPVLTPALTPYAARVLPLAEELAGSQAEPEARVLAQVWTQASVRALTPYAARVLPLVEELAGSQTGVVFLVWPGARAQVGFPDGQKALAAEPGDSQQDALPVRDGFPGGSHVQEGWLEPGGLERVAPCSTAWSPAGLRALPRAATPVWTRAGLQVESPDESSSVQCWPAAYSAPAGCSPGASRSR